MSDINLEAVGRRSFNVTFSRENHLAATIVYLDSYDIDQKILKIPVL